MTSRAPIYAVVILLVSIGVVLLLVGDHGVSTGVFIAGEPTATPAPTVGPTATPLPDPRAENWQEVAAGQLTYTGESGARAQIVHEPLALDALAQDLGAEAPADAAFPMLTVLDAMRASFEQQIADLDMTPGPGTIEGPVLELISDVPVAWLHLQLPAKPADSSDNPFPGLDLFAALIQRPGNEVEIVQYVLSGESDPAAFQDFRAWLETNVTTLAGGEPAAAAPEGAAPDAAQPEATEPAALAPEEATEQPAPEGTEEAAEPAATWTEVQPGALIYSADPAVIAQIVYETMPLETFVTQGGLEPLAEDSDQPLIDALTQIQGQFEALLAAQGIQTDDDAYTGPAMVEVGGHSAARLRLQVPAQTVGEAPFPGIDMTLLLVDVGEGQITAIQYTHQGELAASVNDAFQTWLDENAETVAVPVEEAPAPDATEAPIPDATEDAGDAAGSDTADGG